MTYCSVSMKLRWHERYGSYKCDHAGGCRSLADKRGECPATVKFSLVVSVCLPVAVVALERLRPGVFAVVSRQLVTAGKTPFAALP